MNAVLPPLRTPVPKDPAGAGTEPMSAWDDFWFRPSSARPLCAFRIAVGLLAVGYLAFFITDLNDWFGRQGLLPADVVPSLRLEPYRWSFLHSIDNPMSLRLVHGTALIIAISFACGFLTRLSAVATLVIVLSYVNRAPMISGPFEVTLSMMIAYLCLGPCGRFWSVDSWWRARRQGGTSSEVSIAATISRRLTQVHGAMLYAMMGLTKLGGLAGSTDYDATWWRGEAVWWLIARSESRLINLTWLHSYPLIINLWTHAIVVLEILFPVLIWHRRWAPWLIGLSCLIWPLTGLVTGWVSYSLAMLALNLVYLRCWDPIPKQLDG